MRNRRREVRELTRIVAMAFLACLVLIGAGMLAGACLPYESVVQKATFLVLGILLVFAWVVVVAGGLMLGATQAAAFVGSLQQPQDIKRHRSAQDAGVVPATAPRGTGDEASPGT
jgi:hypothetical protein